MSDMPDTVDGEVLAGGGRNLVIRRGDVVHRQTGAWASSVHALLHHLEQVGFEGAPRVVGSGFDAEGMETLSFIEGEGIHPAPWPEVAFPVLGEMLRKLHDVTASFVPPETAVWRDWFGRALGGANSVIGHCDLGPWNILMRDGVPFALIDWEDAGPVDPMVELAQLCWLNAQLCDDDVGAMVGLAAPEVRARQVRIMLDAYGLAREARKGFVDRMIEMAIADAANEVIEAKVTPQSTDVTPLWAVTWRTRSAAWMFRHRMILENALA